MFFAIIDYVHFKRVSGRYSPFQAKAMHSLYYAREIPQEALDALQEYGAILVGNYNTKLSWLIMYLTDSLYSHVAIYRGGGIVTHHLTNGTITEPVSNLFGSGKTFLPVNFGGDDEGIRKAMNERYSKYSESYQPPGYNFRKVGLLGLQYALCINRHGFHWRNYADLGIFLGMLSLAAWLGGLGTGPGVFALLLWAAIGSVQFFRFRSRWPLFIDAPEATYRVAMQQGWPVLFNLTGYHAYLAEAHDYLLKRHGSMRVGKSYKVPHHLRVRVKD